MAAIAGHGGAVKIAGTPASTVAEVTNWQATLTGAQYDKTALGDEWTDDVPGLKSMTGSITGNWDVTTDAGQTSLHNAILNGASVGLDLLTDDDNSHGYELTAHIDSFQTSVPVNGLVTFTANFRNSGVVGFA